MDVPQRQLDTSHDIWAPKQPDGKKKQDCAQMYFSYYQDFKLNDVDCSEKLTIICEMI